jgi:hypothetical protein
MWTGVSLSTSHYGGAAIPACVVSSGRSSVLTRKHNALAGTNQALVPGMSANRNFSTWPKSRHPGQVRSRSSLKCMVRRLTAREKRRADRQICANVFVNKGEDVVKDKDVLPAAWSNARSQSLETRVRADPFVESFWVGAFSTNHQFGHDCDHDCLFGHPIYIGCEGAYSACRSRLR